MSDTKTRRAGRLTKAECAELPPENQAALEWLREAVATPLTDEDREYWREFRAFVEAHPFGCSPPPGGSARGEGSVDAMSDTKTDETPVSPIDTDEAALPESNRRILAWIRAQHEEPETEETREWGRRFRRFIAEHPFALRGDDSK